jgi:hypothetical protein
LKLKLFLTCVPPVPLYLGLLHGLLSDLESIPPLLVTAAKIISVTKEKSVDRHEKPSA